MSDGGGDPQHYLAGPTSSTLANRAQLGASPANLHGEAMEQTMAEIEELIETIMKAIELGSTSSSYLS